MPYRRIVRCMPAPCLDARFVEVDHRAGSLIVVNDQVADAIVKIHDVQMLSFVGVMQSQFVVARTLRLQVRVARIGEAESVIDKWIEHIVEGRRSKALLTLAVARQLSANARP